MQNKSHFSYKFKQIATSIILAVFLAALAIGQTTHAQSAVRTIIFPVIGAVTYWDDFGAPRSGGRAHEGNDLIGKKMMPLVSAVDGTIRHVVFPEASWGYSVTIEDAEGWSYHYIHINNDTPGTDDGNGGARYAYAADIKAGNPIKAGQLIGWLGDSGNAETTPPHLHFEIRMPDRTPISPYQSLKAAKKIAAPADYPAINGEILPFGEFQGGTFIAAGNIAGSTSAELVAGAGPGGGPHVKIFEENSEAALSAFFAYPMGFRGGVRVAAGDVDGDGVDEVITAPGAGGGPHVKIFKIDGTLVGGFMAYHPRFLGGINVAAADMDSDGKAEIITGPSAGGGPHVRVFKADGSVFSEFLAYDPGFKGGIDVAAAEETIVTAPATGGGPHIRVFDASGNITSEFLAYDEAHRGGVRVSIGNVKTSSSSPEILTGPILGGPDLRLFNLSGTKIDDDSEFEVWWQGFWDVAAYEGQAFASSGPNTRRRASIREAEF